MPLATTTTTTPRPTPLPPYLAPEPKRSGPVVFWIDERNGKSAPTVQRAHYTKSGDRVVDRKPRRYRTSPAAQQRRIDAADSLFHDYLDGDVNDC